MGHTLDLPKPALVLLDRARHDAFIEQPSIRRLMLRVGIIVYCELDWQF